MRDLTTCMPCWQPALTGIMALVLLGGTSRAAADDFQGSAHLFPYDEEVINYSQRVPDDPISRLQARLDAGEVKLEFDNELGYLPGLLKALDIPVSSQTIVFSKTSLQRTLITPKNPRALYFNDDVYLGFIPGSSIMEISAVDPKLGGTFYTLDQEKLRRPKFKRGNDCLNCHASPKTMGVPGHLVRSIGTDETGELLNLTEVSHITHRTPLADRWAGWYVTGQHGDQTHRGNLIGPEEFTRHEQMPNWRGNLDHLGSLFTTTKYPLPTSDIVALMVLEHQVHMHNYITRLNYEAQQMMKWYGHIRYLNSQVNAFLRYLLMTEEAPLTAPLKGDPAFVKAFESKGPRDRQGRSLRELDMQTRMFKYPCSFLIHSDAFDQMPDVIRNEIYRRLLEVLTGEDQSEDFENLTRRDRLAVLEILRDTKKNLPANWTTEAAEPPAKSAE